MGGVCKEAVELRLLAVVAACLAAQLHYGTGAYTCPKGKGWQVHNGYCYNVNTTHVDWHTAREYCRQMDATLVSIHSQEEQDYLRQTARYGGWIGLHDIKTEDNFVWIDEDTPVNFTNWNTGEPNNAAENCVYMYASYGTRKGTWSDGYCRSTLPYVCKKTAGAGGCENGWQQFTAHCYNFSRSRLSWMDAREACQGEGALASIMDEAENNFIKSKIFSNTWIGLNDIKAEGQFVWLDQTAEPSYFKWYQGEPNNAGNVEEDCVDVYGEYYRRGQWSDNYCGLHNAYLCEKAKESNRCDDGWREFEDHCYKVFDDVLRSWFASRKACQAEGADLGVIDSDGEHNFLKPLYRKRTWIGLHDQREEDEFVWLDTKQKPNRTYWRYNEPSSGMKGRADCVIVNVGQHNKGKWNNVRCSHTYPYVCELKPENGQSCPDNWFTFSGNCYRYHADKTNWNYARARCVRMNATADLVKIDTVEEQDYINSIIRGNAWIGLRFRKGIYKWLNESNPATWTNWDFGKPDQGVEEDCVDMKSYSGKWNDYDCSAKKGFTCKAKAGGDFSYYDFRYNNSVYKVLRVKLARDDANKLCGDLMGVNATLLQLDSADELAALVPELNMRNYVISRYIKPSFWIAGDPRDNSTYRRWGSSIEPVPGRSCMTLNSLSYSYSGPTQKDNYRMYSKSCCDQHMSICEKVLGSDQKLGYKDYDFMYKNSIYKIVSTEKLNIEAAAEKCQSMLGEDADLIGLDNDEEYKFVFREMRIRHIGETLKYWVSSDPQISPAVAKLTPKKSPDAKGAQCMIFNQTLDITSIKLNEKLVLKSVPCNEAHPFICERQLPETTIVYNMTEAPSPSPQKVAVVHDTSGCKGTCLGLAIAYPFVIIGVAALAVWLTLYLRKQRSFGFSFHKSADQPYVEFMGEDPAKS